MQYEIIYFLSFWVSEFFFVDYPAKKIHKFVDTAENGPVEVDESLMHFPSEISENIKKLVWIITWRNRHALGLDFDLY